jgi:16S rRNA (uracil1498-N3)-methyltransferase
MPELSVFCGMSPYFFQEQLPASGETLQLTEDTSKHCVQVLRMREGDALRLTDGMGRLAHARITSAHKKNCLVQLTAVEAMKRQGPDMGLAISPLKNTGRFEWLLEKVTELGITHIIPIVCQRTEKVYFKPERMRGILISALLQSQQCWLPQLAEPTPVLPFISQSTQYEQRMMAHCMEGNKTPLAKAVNPLQNRLVMIGPEGDFTPAELELALQAGFTPISLGNNRLRTETAGIAAAALLTLVG